MTLQTRLIQGAAFASIAAVSLVPAASSNSGSSSTQSTAVFRVPTKKLSIYDEPAESQTVADATPNQLELLIREARMETSKTFASTRKQIQNLVDQWIALEDQVHSFIKTYREPTEDVLPNLIYVTIAGFAGSIAAKNSNILFRAAFPLIGTAGAFAYLFPATTRNLAMQRPASSFPPVQPGDFSVTKALSDAMDKLAHLLGVSPSSK